MLEHIVSPDDRDCRKVKISILKRVIWLIILKKDINKHIQMCLFETYLVYLHSKNIFI